MMTATGPLSLQDIRIVPLPDKEHLKKFCCGVSEIDAWARGKCSKFHERHRTRAFCAVRDGARTALGFYSLTFQAEEASKIAKNDQSPYLRSGVPLIYIQYLAVERNLQRNQLGTLLLVNALWRAHMVSRHVGVYGVALRSLNEQTTRLYSRYGFIVREESERCPLMILPVWSLIDLFEDRKSGPSS